MRIVMTTDDVTIDRRIILEAESLINQGHEVILLAIGESQLPQYEMINRIKVERYNPYRKTRKTGKLNLLKRVFRFLFNIPNLDKRVAKRIAYYQPDIIHVHDLPRLKSGALGKHFTQAPLIYDAHELYPEIHTLNRRQQRSLFRLEKKIIPQADAVITVNDFIAAEMQQRYKITKPNVLLNATKPPENFDPKSNYDLIRQKLGLDQNAKIILYQGWIYKPRGLQPLIEAMSYVDSNYHCVLMGYGEDADLLQTLAKQLKLSRRVHFINAVPQQELLFWTHSADVGIIPYQAIDLNNYYCSPNKLFEFIQARTPIIANNLPFLQKTIGDYAIGITKDLSDAQSYAAAINEFFSFSNQQKGLLQANLAKAAAELNWQIEEKKLLALYDRFKNNKEPV